MKHILVKCAAQIVDHLAEIANDSASTESVLLDLWLNFLFIIFS